MADVSTRYSSCRNTMSLDEMFSQAALSFPDNTAVTYIDGFEQEHLTYHELDKRALQISSCLKTFCKSQNTIIGICSRKIPGLIACMLGVLRIPAAFAPIGLDWPVKMTKEYMETSGIDIVVVSKELREKFQQVLSLLKGSNKTFKLITDLEVLRLNGLVVAVANESSFLPDYDQPLAYVMQTSGTTGEPTLVKVPHVCVVPNITSLAAIFEMTEEDSVAVTSPYTFDPFIVQLFLALFSGGRAVIVSEVFKLQTEKLCQVLFDELKISVFQPTPYLMYLIGHERIKKKILGQQSPLKILAMGAETCPTYSVLRSWKHPKCKSRLFNLYGMTEVSSWASCFEVTDKELYDKGTSSSEKKIVVGDEVMDLSEEVPLGLPLEDTILEVRDENGSRIDEGVGLIFIGGCNRVCYLGNETSFHPSTMRSSGDLGYINENKLWFVGRKNRCIKRNSKEISLDWLEQSLSMAFPDCVFCAVTETLPGDQQCKICLFVKPETLCSERQQLRDSFKRELRETYPPYAYPDYIGIVSEMPLTSHGKVDTKALLKTRHEEMHSLLDESVEEILEHIWSKGIREREDSHTVASSATGADDGTGEPGDQMSRKISNSGLKLRIKREDMFVEHGGSSVDALRVANEIKAWFHQKTGSEDELSELVDVILNCSFGKLCDYIKTRISGQSSSSKSTVSQDMAEKTGHSQGDIHLTSAVDDSSKFSRLSERETILKLSKNDDGDDGEDGDDGDGEDGDDDDGEDGDDEDGEDGDDDDDNDGEDGDDEDGDDDDDDGEDGDDDDGEDGDDDDDREVTMPVPPKKRKIEDLKPAKTSAQTEVATRLPRCFCSIQRGMHATTCRSCITPATSGGAVHTQGPLKGNISQKWKANFHKCIDASPLVVGTNDKDMAVVYLGSHAHVFKAVHLSNGNVLWETRLGDRIEASAALTRCGQYVVVGCYDGKVYVLHRHNGRVTWTYQTGGPVKSSPCVDSSTGLVWIGSHDHHLYALDVDQRDCVASIDCGSSCFSSPSVLDTPHLVFIGTLGGLLCCVNASTQTMKWSIQCPQPIFSSPLTTTQGVVYACVDGVVYHCDLDANPLWEFKTTEAVFSSPSMFRSSISSESKGNILFGSHDGFVYCLSDSGEMRWKFETDSQVYSSPFVALVQLYAHSNAVLSHEPDNTSDAVVVVSSTRGTTYFLSLDEGLLISSWTFPGQAFSSPIIIGNDVLVGCRDDFLYCLKIT